MTVIVSLLRTIIAQWPVVPSHLVHSAGRTACLSGAQRLRQLHKENGVDYEYRDHHYYFHSTPLLILYSILKEKEDK